MSQSLHYTKSPIVVMEHTALQSFVDVSGFGHHQIIPFDAKLIWIRECDAEVVLKRGERLLQELGTYCDRGYLTSVESAVKEAKAYCEREAITRDSEIKVEIRMKVTDTPALHDLSPRMLDFIGRSSDMVGYTPFGDNFSPRNHARIAYRDEGQFKAWLEAPSEHQFDLHEKVNFVNPKERENKVVWDSSLHLGNEQADQDLSDLLATMRAAISPKNAELVQIQRDVMDKRAEQAQSR